MKIGLTKQNDRAEYDVHCWRHAGANFRGAASPVDEQEIIAFVAERVAPYKKVRRVEFVEAIPKSASGKILRRILVERELAVVAASG